MAHQEPANWKTLGIGYEEALARVPDALKAEGFGVITEIDLHQTFKTKLGLESRRYRILGACNPTFAHAAVTHDPSLGVLLPCNVAVYETDDGKARVGMIDPMRLLSSAAPGSSPGSAGASDAELEKLSREVGERLARVLASLP